MRAIGLPWPPNIQIDGSTYLVRPLALMAPANVPERVFIFEEDGSPVLTVRSNWASYPEALYTAEQRLREHLSETPVDVFGSA
jgi:hypothetical protein